MSVKTPFPAWCLFALLAATSLAPVLSAQEVRYGIVSQPDSLLPDATNAQTVLTDPEGDVGTFVLGDVGPMPWDGTVDLLEMGLAETEDKLLFSIKHRDYDPLMNAVQSASPVGGWYGCWGGFGMAGDDIYRYNFEFYMEQDELGSNYFAGYAYMYERRGDRGYGDHLGELLVALVAEDHVELVYDKAPIKVGPDGRGLAVGDRISDLYINCWRSGILLVDSYDWVEGPGTGTGTYKVTMASGSSMVAGHFVDDEGERTLGSLSMPAGTSQKVSLLLTNLRSSRLIVNMTAAVVGVDGKPLDGWKAIVAPVLELPADGEQRATVVVTAPADAKHRDTADLVVSVRPLGDDAVAKIKRPLIVMVAPSPEQNVLYFHNVPWRSCFICVGGSELAPFDFTRQRFVMNVLKEDPEFGEATRESKPLRIQPGDEDAVAYIDAELSRPIRLAGSGKIELTLALASDVERDVVLRAAFGYEADESGFFTSEDTLARVGPSSSVTIDIPTGPDAVQIAAGGWFAVSVDIVEQHAVLPASPFTSGTGAGIDWVTAGSSLKLPLLPVQGDTFDLTDGASLPTIQLRNGTERETYINPGKTHAFDLRLVNEGIAQDKLTVTVTPSDPAWGVKVEPGRRFALAPGQSAPFSVLLTAPPDAAEGAAIALNLSATSDNDPRVRTTLVLKAVATDHEIEAKAYTPPPAEEVVPPLQEAKREAPAPLLPLFLLMLLALVAVTRRRR